MPAKSSLLSLKGFGLAFGARLILRDISFDLAPEGCTVLLGPSGTGKSTMMRTLAGMLASHGTVRIWGEVTFKERPWTMEGDRPALVEQKPQLLVAKVWDNLVTELPDRSELTRMQQMDVVSQYLEQMGQEHLMEQLQVPVIDLPVEQQRNVAILRKGIARPPLLMVDEPTAHLKDAAAAVVTTLLKKLAKQTPLLIVSHHQGHTREVADRVILIANGVVQEDATVGDFFNHPRNELTRHYLRTGSCPEVGPGPLEEVLNQSEPPAQMLELHPAADVPAQASLQVPSVPEYHAPASAGPRGFVWLLGGLVAGTPQPGIGLTREVEDDLRALKSVGISHLISLTESPFKSDALPTYGIETSFTPIPDMHAPTLSDALGLCHEIDLLLTKGKSVAVHCKAGLGRTGTVLAAYWIWRHQGKIRADEAVAYVRRLEPRMIQSSEQEEFLTRFAAELRTMTLSFQDQAESST